MKGPSASRPSLQDDPETIAAADREQGHRAATRVGSRRAVAGHGPLPADYSGAVWSTGASARQLPGDRHVPQPTAGRPAEARQRWRPTYRRRRRSRRVAGRSAEQRGRGLGGGARSLRACPAVGLDLPRRRPRLVFGAPSRQGWPPMPSSSTSSSSERCPVAAVRERLVPRCRPSHELVDAHDVWLGEPPLSGQVVAADYLVSWRRPARRAPSGPLVRELIERAPGSCSPRARSRGRATRAAAPSPTTSGLSDLAHRGRRKLLAGPLRLASGSGRCFDPERGVGRPEEVVAALGEGSGPILRSARSCASVILVGETAHARRSADLAGTDPTRRRVLRSPSTAIRDGGSWCVAPSSGSKSSLSLLAPVDAGSTSASASLRRSSGASRSISRSHSSRLPL